MAAQVRFVWWFQAKEERRVGIWRTAWWICSRKLKWVTLVEATVCENRETGYREALYKPKRNCCIPIIRWWEQCKLWTLSLEFIRGIFCHPYQCVWVKSKWLLHQEASQWNNRIKSTSREWKQSLDGCYYLLFSFVLFSIGLKLTWMAAISSEMICLGVKLCVQIHSKEVNSLQ